MKPRKLRERLERLARSLEKLSERLGRKPKAPSREAIARGHEGVGINFRVIGGVAIGIVLSAIVIHVALLLLMGFYERQTEAERGPGATFASPEGRFPEPRLQIAPDRDLQRLRETEEDFLERYAWVDRSRGLIRLPIRRAMELLASPSVPTGRRTP